MPVYYHVDSLHLALPMVCGFESSFAHLVLCKVAG